VAARPLLDASSTTRAALGEAALQLEAAQALVDAATHRLAHAQRAATVVPQRADEAHVRLPRRADARGRDAHVMASHRLLLQQQQQQHVQVQQQKQAPRAQQRRRERHAAALLTEQRQQQQHLDDSTGGVGVDNDDDDGTGDTDDGDGNGDGDDGDTAHHGARTRARAAASAAEAAAREAALSQLQAETVALTLVLPTPTWRVSGDVALGTWAAARALLTAADAARKVLGFDAYDPLGELSEQALALAAAAEAGAGARVVAPAAAASVSGNDAIGGEGRCCDEGDDGDGYRGARLTSLVRGAWFCAFLGGGREDALRDFVVRAAAKDAVAVAVAKEATVAAGKDAGRISAAL
jgi:hypothetical protein